MFNRKDLEKIVEKVIPSESGRTNAIILTADENDGMAVTIKMKFRGRWEMEGVFKRDWTGDIGAEAKVVYSW